MTPEFWKGRISSSPVLRHSVYRCDEIDWQRINQHHHHMLNKHIDVKKDKVLEAGCAYGRWSYLFSNYTGVDISPDFIKLAQESYPDNADNFLVGDLRNLPFDDDTFDWCFLVSIKGMIIREMGKDVWDSMETELIRVSKKILILEYSNSLPDNPKRDNVEILTK